MKKSLVFILLLCLVAASFFSVQKVRAATRVVTVEDWGYGAGTDKGNYVVQDLNTLAIVTGTGRASITVPIADSVQIGYTSMITGQFYHFMSPWDDSYHINGTVELPSTFNVVYFCCWTNYALTVNANRTECATIYVYDVTTGLSKVMTNFPDTFTFFPNENISVTAVPKTNFVFHYWNSLSHSTQPYSAILYSDMTRTAYFTYISPTPSPSPVASSVPWNLTWLLWAIIIAGFVCLTIVIGHAAVKHGGK